MLSGRIKDLLERIFTKPLHGAITTVNGVFNNITEDIMEYVIEGTVKELEVKKEKGKVIWSFKIAGTEGYALRQKKKEDDKETTRYNVLCLKDSENPDDKKPRNAITFAEDSPFQTEDKEYGCLITSALANGRKCKFCFSVKEEDKKDFDSKNCTISSLALLAE